MWRKGHSKVYVIGASFFYPYTIYSLKAYKLGQIAIIVYNCCLWVHKAFV
jgi:hypothetical protein